MKKLIYVLAILACVACHSTQSHLESQMQEQAEMVISRSAEALTGVSMEDDQAFSEAFAVMEASLDEAYDSFASDEERRQFNEYLRNALEDSDIDKDAAFMISANIRAY